MEILGAILAALVPLLTLLASMYANRRTPEARDQQFTDDVNRMIANQEYNEIAATLHKLYRKAHRYQRPPAQL